jgi:anti-sigma B factor antagonist
MDDEAGALTVTVMNDQDNDNRAGVTAAGEVDIHTCGQLEDALLTLADAGVRTVTLDLGSVAFIDSSGLRALVVGHKALEEQGGALIVTNPSPTAARLLEVTGLDSLFRGTSAA